MNITVNLNHGDNDYIVVYEPIYEDKNYRGHRIFHVLKHDKSENSYSKASWHTWNSGLLLDKRDAPFGSIKGVFGEMALIEETGFLVPSWIIRLFNEEK